MIGYRAKRYCCEDISLIENYDKAVADKTQTWQCHHRAEILPCGNFTPEMMMEFGLYFNRPASELIFLTKYDHLSIHTKARWTGRHHSEEAKIKISEANTGRKRSLATRRLMSEQRIGSRNSFYGKHHTSEAKEKIRRSRIGKHFPKLSAAKRGKKVPNLSKAKLGLHWFNNGIEERYCFECPIGFTPGRLRR